MGKNNELSESEVYVGPAPEEYSTLFDEIISLRERTLKRHESALHGMSRPSLPQSQDQDPLAQEFFALAVDAERLGARTRTAIQLAQEQPPTVEQWHNMMNVLHMRYGDKPMRELLSLALQDHTRRLTRMIDALGRMTLEDEEGD